MTWIDRVAHPIDDRGYRASCAAQLDDAGALVLSDFFTDAFVSGVLDESQGREDEAFFANSTHNIWLTPVDQTLPTT